MQDNEWKSICAACAEGTPPERCVYYGEPNGCNAPTLGKHPEGDLSERLQEALEKAERRIAELESAPGNAAAMREALETVLENHDRMILPEICCPNCGEDFQLRGNLPPDITRKVKAALAAPARNADRFGGDEEKLIEACLNERGLLITENFRDVFADWLLAPAKGGAE